MDERNAADLFVDCLESEGVEYVFGIPGEETLDLNRALADSDVRFVPVRHEQGGAYMADMYGRLTHRAGVCLGTLGPGATNLVTGVADAWLDRSPLVALTGQGDLERTHKESHQYLDVISLFKPITKWNARLNSPAMIPEAVRKAFKVAQGQKPGPTHLELPEDVMGSPAGDARPLTHRQERRRPEPSQGELDEAAELIRGAEYPLVLAGNGISRGDAAPALRAFAHATGMGVAATFMGKGVLEDSDPHWRGTVGMQARDYELAGFEHADVVITVGYDLVEHSPDNWNPKRDKVGRGTEEGVDVGPLIDADQRDKVAELVQDAVGKGAEAVVGGKPIDGQGYFFSPTVLAGVTDDARVLKEEIFGPVAPVATFGSEEEALTAANDTEFGLVAYVYTRDLQRAIRVCEGLETGMVGLNQGMVSNATAPFGGVKQSGFGREGGKEGIQEYLETKYVAMAV